MQFRIGRPVDLRLGDPNSIFCRVEDPSGSMVFHGFGVCRIQLDKVTHAHQGFWKLYVGAPGHILTHQYFIDVKLIEPGNFHLYCKYIKFAERGNATSIYKTDKNITLKTLY